MYVGLEPGQFWDATPIEFQLICENYRERDQRDMGRWAWAQANLMNVWTSKKVKVSDIWNDGSRQFLDRDDMHEHIREQQQEAAIRELSK